MWAWTNSMPQKKTGTNGETFGQRLARLRKAAGYSQRQFAPEVGISQRMLCYYEAQSEHPPAHLLPTIAQALNITTDQLLGVEPIPKRQPPLNRIAVNLTSDQLAAL